MRSMVLSAAFFLEALVPERAAGALGAAMLQVFWERGSDG